MKHKIISFLLCLVLASSAAFAQGHQDKAKRQQWFQNMVNAKIEYLSKQLNLSPDQQAKFEKSYRAMSQETSKLANDTRALQRSVSKKASATDLEYEKAGEAMAEFKAKEGAIELKYFNQFKSFLTKKQLFQLKIAEHNWMKQIMKQRGKKK